MADGNEAKFKGEELNSSVRLTQVPSETPAQRLVGLMGSIAILLNYPHEDGPVVLDPALSSQLRLALFQTTTVRDSEAELYFHLGQTKMTANVESFSNPSSQLNGMAREVLGLLSKNYPLDYVVKTQLIEVLKGPVNVEAVKAQQPKVQSPQAPRPVAPKPAPTLPQPPGNERTSGQGTQTRTVEQVQAENEKKLVGLLLDFTYLFSFRREGSKRDRTRPINSLGEILNGLTKDLTKAFPNGQTTQHFGLLQELIEGRTSLDEVRQFRLGLIARLGAENLSLQQFEKLEFNDFMTGTYFGQLLRLLLSLSERADLRVKYEKATTPLMKASEVKRAIPSH